jgi:ATP-dependent Clp protease ATP-binding subunit ClpC
MIEVKLSDEARFLLHQARAQAKQRNHGYIGAEHILLGIASQEGSLTAQVLTNLGAPPYKIRHHVDFMAPRNERSNPQALIRLTPRSRTVIRLAIEEAKQSDSRLIESWHILIGLIQESESMAAAVLENLGQTLMTPAQVRWQIRLLAGPTID